MQIKINRDYAYHVMATAPTTKTVEGSIEGHHIGVCFFDYGVAMGWGDFGDDVRSRVYLDGARVDHLGISTISNRRPSWLPKGVTIKAWNETIENLTKGDQDD